MTRGGSLKTCECDYFHDNECALVGFKTCDGEADYTECASFTKDFRKGEYYINGSTEELQA